MGLLAFRGESVFTVFQFLLECSGGLLQFGDARMLLLRGLRSRGFILCGLFTRLLVGCLQFF